MQSEQQQRIMGYFIEEAKDHLNTIEQGLLNLQGTIGDPDLVNEVFRAAHSVKGGAAMLGLDSIQKTAHRLEDYFKVLKECPLQVDQKLETLFLRVFDTLQDLLEQLQGPFGLTDDKAAQIMTDVDPVLAELNVHLSQLVEQSGSAPPSEVDLSSHATPTAASQPAPAASAPQPEDSALKLYFQSEVPAQLRTMLQLLKQPDTQPVRQQLQDLCSELAHAGDSFDLPPNWGDLATLAQRAIANPDNSFRSLAPALIKDFKHAQDLVLSGRAGDIAPSSALQDLQPIAAVIEEEEAVIAADEVMDDIADILAIDTTAAETEDPSDTIEISESSESLDDAFASLDNITMPDDSAKTAEDFDIDSDDNFDLFNEDINEDITREDMTGALDDDFLFSSSDETHRDENDIDESSHGNTLDLSLDSLDSETPPSGETLRNGPQVGTAELNSLADLFENESPELGLDWQEEVIDDSSDLSDLLVDDLDLDASSDFSDLLFDEKSDGVSTNGHTNDDDISALLNQAENATTPENVSSALSENEEFADLFEIGTDTSHEASDSDLSHESLAISMDNNTAEKPSEAEVASELNNLGSFFSEMEEDVIHNANQESGTDINEEGEAASIEAISLEVGVPEATNDLSRDTSFDSDFDDLFGTDDHDTIETANDSGEGGSDAGFLDIETNSGEEEFDVGFLDSEMTGTGQADDDFLSELTDEASPQERQHESLDEHLLEDLQISALDDSEDTANLTDNVWADVGAESGDSELGDSASLDADDLWADVGAESGDNTLLDDRSSMDVDAADTLAEELDDLDSLLDDDDTSSESIEGESESSIGDGTEFDNLLDDLGSELNTENANAEAAIANELDLGFDLENNLNHDLDRDIDTSDTLDQSDDLDLNNALDESLGSSEGTVSTPTSVPSDDIASDDIVSESDSLEDVFDLEGGASDASLSMSDAELSDSSFDFNLESTSGNVIDDDADLFGTETSPIDDSTDHETDFSDTLFDLDADTPEEAVTISEDLVNNLFDAESSDETHDLDIDLESLGGNDSSSTEDIDSLFLEDNQSSEQDDHDPDLTEGLTEGLLEEISEELAEELSEESIESPSEVDVSLSESLSETTLSDDFSELDSLAMDDGATSNFIETENSLSNSLSDIDADVAELDDLDIDEGFEAELFSLTDDTDQSNSLDTDALFNAMDNIAAEGDASSSEDDPELINISETGSLDLDDGLDGDIEAIANNHLANGEAEVSAGAETSNLDDLDALLDETNENAEPAFDASSEIAVTEARPDSDLESFDDLEAFLSSSDLSEDHPTPDADVTGTVDDDSFNDLEALLDPSRSDDAESLLESSTEAAPLSTTEDDFSDLEKLLEDADQTMGGSPTAKAARGPSQAPTRRPVRRGGGGFTDQTMRVSVKNLDNLNNLVGELVVNRNSLEQSQERLRQFLDNLLYQVQQLSDVGQRMRDLYERSLLESSLLSSRRSHQIANQASAAGALTDTSHATGANFDALEMDRFTGFHTLSQEMIELIVRVREAASDIDFVVDESDQITRMFRQVTTQLQEGLTRSRMVPFAQAATRLPRAVRDISIKCGKQAELLIEGKDTLIDKMILEQLYDPMTHLVNNAITHGIETPEERQALGKPAAGKITIRVFHQGNQTIISVTDDGAGIDPDKVKQKALQRGLISPEEAETMSRLDVYDLLFHHGFSTRDQADDFAGRGVGMDVVRTSLSEIRGVINIDSVVGQGTTFTIRLPLTLSISKALLCVSNRARIAFPMDGVEDMLDVPRDRIQMDDQERSCILWRDIMLPFHPLDDLLKYNRMIGRGSIYGGSQEEDIISVIVLRSAGNYLALQVDQVLGEQEIVIKQLEAPIPKPAGIAGATVLGDGRIMPIADVLELIDLSMGRIRREAGSSLWEQEAARIAASEVPDAKSEPTVLIVDDSITVRELLSMTFNKVGYRVEQARDGQEAWEKLKSGLPCDLVFCDIEMPRMDGLELLSRLQKDVNLRTLPIAMLTSRGADRHRQMAVQLGAKGYFTKPYLEEALLDAAQRMLNGEVLVGSNN